MDSRAASYAGCEGPAGLEEQLVGTNPYWPLPVGILGRPGRAHSPDRPRPTGAIMPRYLSSPAWGGEDWRGSDGAGCRNRGPLEAVDQGVKALRDDRRHLQEGYEILYRRRPGRRYDHYSFQVFRKGQVLGYLDADYVAGKQWLLHRKMSMWTTRHGNQGLATALLVTRRPDDPLQCADHSARTPRGVRFFDKNRGVLKKYGSSCSKDGRDDCFGNTSSLCRFYFSRSRGEARWYIHSLCIKALSIKIAFGRRPNETAPYGGNRAGSTCGN